MICAACVAVAMAGLACVPAAFAQKPVGKVVAPVQSGSGPIGVSDDPVKEFTVKLAGSNVTFDYTYVMEGGKVDLSGSGSIVMQDKSYYIEGDGMRIWCDGNAVWTMDVVAGEVVIEAPDTANGFTADPILTLTECGSLYSWDKDGVPSSFGGMQCWLYSLKSKGDAEFDSVKLYLAGDILAGAVLQADKMTFTFTVSSFQYRPHDSKAVFVPESFPDGCVVTDLR